MAAQESVTSIPAGSATFSKPNNPTPPVRQKRILRIEDPNTHEALDLQEISSRAQAKAEQQIPNMASVDSKDSDRIEEANIEEQLEQRIEEHAAVATEEKIDTANAVSSAPHEVCLTWNQMQ